MILLALLLPMAAAIVALVTSWHRWLGHVSALASGGVVTVGVFLAIQTRHHALTAAGGWLRADALSSFMVVLIGAVSLLATSQTSRYMTREMEMRTTTSRRARLYVVLTESFITAMLLAVLTSNLGILWVAIEATTIATTFLVSHSRTKRAFEASWKYVVLCSVGIALAFLGTVFIYYAALHPLGGLPSTSSLDWVSLLASAPHLNPHVMRFAFALLVLGYGTKVGLAPMHSWLADAHSQAPAPVSALMSGVLLSVAFYALLRLKAVADISLGVTFPRLLFISVGLLSVGVAALMLIAQRDLKRMLAYSSVEHMGLLALGAAAGSPLAVAAVLLHMLGHGLTKSVLFLSAGEIYVDEGTTEMVQIRSLLARRPVLGGLFVSALVALLGFPPFSLFVSEFAMARGEVEAGFWWVVAISMGLLLIIMASMTHHARSMLLGSSNEPIAATPRSLAMPLVVAMVVCAGIGLSAWPLGSFLRAAAQVVAR